MRLKMQGGVVYMEVSALWPPGHVGTDCCFKCPRVAERSPRTYQHNLRGDQCYVGVSAKGPAQLHKKQRHP